VGGKCLAIDKSTQTPISKRERLNWILEREGFSLLEKERREKKSLERAFP
jgi:hypothetical protein